jgi:hypothetical protein
VFIPEAVWSLDLSSGVHLDHFSGAFRLEFDTALTGRQENADFWTGAIPNLWPSKGAGENSDRLQFLPLSLQVASCGDSSAEHSDLDYCGAGYGAMGVITNNSDNSKGSSSNSATIVQDIGSSNPTSSSTVSTSNLQNQSNAAPAAPSYPIIPPIIKAHVTQSNLIGLSDLSDCGDDNIYASCPAIAMQPWNGTD